LDNLVEYLGELIQDAFLISPRKVRISVGREAIQVAAKKISNLTSFISTITGVDCEDRIIELHYHFVIPKKNLAKLKLESSGDSNLFSEPETLIVTMMTVLHRHDLKIDSIARIFPGAQFYEREIQEMFGIKIRGIFSSEYLLLADDFPSDVHPLRKTTSLDAMISEHKKERERRSQDQDKTENGEL
jgi:Ni,Fe-hydrogenase III component G